MAQDTHVASVVADPYPVLLAFTPLHLFSLEYAVIAWIAISLFILIFSATLYFGTPPSPWLLLLPASEPLFRALTLKTTSVLWLGLIFLLLHGIQKRKCNTIIGSTLLLALKPQDGLLFSLAGLISILKTHRDKLPAFTLISLLFLGISLAIDPTWLAGWFTALQSYSEQAMVYWMLPIGLLFPLFGYGYPWIVSLSIAQVTCLPINDIYSALPLLLAWTALPLPLALFGVSLSWLRPLLYSPTSLDPFWSLNVFPLIIFLVGYRFYQRHSTKSL